MFFRCFFGIGFYYFFVKEVFEIKVKLLEFFGYVIMIFQKYSGCVGKYFSGYYSEGFLLGFQKIYEFFELQVNVVYLSIFQKNGL